MLLVKNKSYLFTDSRYIERAKNTIKKGIKIVDITKIWRNPKVLKEEWQKILKKHKIKILGIEESNLTIAKFKKFKKLTRKKTKRFSIKFTDISGFIEKKREIKSPQEIRLIEKSQRLNEKVFNEIKKQILSETKRPPIKLREIDLVWRIGELAHKFGADDISFEPIVAFGKHSATPHHKSDTTRLKKGDLILIDMGMKYKGYCSDMTRIIFTTTPTEKQKKIYNLVLKAQKEGIKKIKAGITGKQADSFSRKIIENAGYGEKYGHGGGHGVGLDIHEIPSLSEEYKEKLKANSVITVEPGIYLEGEFGIRIEDMILITKNGNKKLTKQS